MATLTAQTDSVYGVLAGRLTAAAPEYRVAPWAGEMFAVEDSGSVSQGSVNEYSIEVSESRWPDGIRRAALVGREAIETHTTVAIRWLSALVLDDPAAGYQEALEHEYRVVQALCLPAPNEADGDATGRPVRVRPSRIRRQVVEGVWLIHELSATVDHALTLTGP